MFKIPHFFAFVSKYCTLIRNKFSVIDFIQPVHKTDKINMKSIQPSSCLSIGMEHIESILSFN